VSRIEIRTPYLIVKSPIQTGHVNVDIDKVTDQRYATLSLIGSLEKGTEVGKRGDFVEETRLRLVDMFIKFDIHEKTRQLVLGKDARLFEEGPPVLHYPLFYFIIFSWCSVILELSIWCHRQCLPK